MALGISYAVRVSGKVFLTNALAMSWSERLAAGSLKNCMVPPSPARNSAVTPLGFVVMRYAGLSAGCDTENAPSAAVKRGLISTGVPLGGLPQSGGHT